MPITVTAETVSDFRDQVALMFPSLAGTVPLPQLPGPDTKAEIEATERIAALTAERDDARQTVAKLEAAYSAQAKVLREAQAAREGAAGLSDALAEADVMLMSIRTTLGVGGGLDMDLAALVREIKDERDQARAALQEAQEALESTRADMDKLRSVVGTSAADQAPKRGRGRKTDTPASTAAPAGTVTPESAAVAPDGKWANDLEPASGETRPAPPPPGSLGALAPKEFADTATDPVTGVKLPAAFTRLAVLEPAAVVPGLNVVVCVPSEKSPTGWATPAATVRKHFEGTDRYEVEIDRRGCEVLTLDHIRATPVDRDFLEEAVQAQAAKEAPTFGTELPTPPDTVTPPADAPVNDAIADRLITEEERVELGALAKELKLDVARMGALIEKHFAPKKLSVELTVTELAKLREVMQADAKVPF